MLILSDHCPECGGSLMDGGAGNRYVCRVCRTKIETDGDGAITRMETPVDDELPDYEAGDDLPDEDEATEILGELFKDR